MRLIFLSIAALAFASSAQAQVTKSLCESIQSFFTSPPSRFIAERGIQMDEDGWMSKTTKGCSVFHMKDPYGLKDGFGHPHRVTCDLAPAKDDAALLRAYTDAVAEIRKCIPRIQARLKFAERTIETGQSRWTVWEAKDAKDGYRVTVQVDLRSSGKSALFSIEFQPAK